MPNHSSESNSDGLSARVLTTASEIERIRTAWEKLQWHPNADIDYFLLINRLHKREPYVIAISDQKEIVALAVGRLGVTQLKCSIGYKTIFEPRVRELAIISGGIMGIKSDTVLEIVMKCLSSALRNDVADVASLAEVRTDESLWKVALRRPFLLCRDAVPKPQAHFGLALPKSPDGLFAHLKSKHRTNLKRYYKIMERDFPGEIQIRHFHKPEDVAEFCSTAENIAAKSYLRTLGVGFYDNPAARDQIALYSRRGAFQGYVLYVKDQPCAFWFGNSYRSVFYVGLTAFDPAFSDYQVGTVLLTKMLEDLVANGNGLTRFDFGLGGAVYKSILSTEVWQESTIYIFAPSLKAITINLVRTPILTGHNAIQTLLRRFDLENKVKRLFRRKAPAKPAVIADQNEKVSVGLESN